MLPGLRSCLTLCPVATLKFNHWLLTCDLCLSTTPRFEFDTFLVNDGIEEDRSPRLASQSRCEE